MGRTWVGILVAVSMFVAGGQACADDCRVPPPTHMVSPQTYPWLAFRQSLESLRDGIAACPDGSGYQGCEQSIIRRLGQRVPELGSTVASLATKQYGGGWDSNVCSPATTINIETVKQIPDYCWSGKPACLDSINGSIDILLAAQDFEPCIDGAIAAARFAAPDSTRAGPSVPRPGSRVHHARSGRLRARRRARSRVEHVPPVSSRA